MRVLERDVRRWRVAAVAALGVAVVALVVGTLPTAGARGIEPPLSHTVSSASEIIAERFVLRDARGAVRATLGAIDDGTPVLTFFDATGAPRAALTPSQLALSGQDAV